MQLFVLLKPGIICSYISDPFWWSIKNVDCFIELKLGIHRKVNGQFFVSTQACQMFLSIKNVLEKKSEDQPVNALPYYFSPHF